MIKRWLIALSIIFLFVSGAVAEDFGWNPEKGKKLFVAKVKKQICKKKLSIKKFTQAHTQKEWKEIIENGKFEEEFQKLCPDYVIGSLTPKQIDSLGDAAVNYASDSYNIPS